MYFQVIAALKSLKLVHIFYLPQILFSYYVIKLYNKRGTQYDMCTIYTNQRYINLNFFLLLLYVTTNANCPNGLLYQTVYCRIK